MKLTKEDVEQLKAWGFREQDIPQLQEAANKTRYELIDVGGGRTVGVRDVVKEIGRTNWLSGIARSAFHWTAVRFNDDKSTRIDFDSSKIFES